MTRHTKDAVFLAKLDAAHELAAEIKRRKELERELAALRGAAQARQGGPSRVETVATDGHLPPSPSDGVAQTPFHPDSNMPDCMMPDGGECCTAYADLHCDWHQQRRRIRELEDAAQCSGDCGAKATIKDLMGQVASYKKREDDRDDDLL